MPAQGPSKEEADLTGAQAFENVLQLLYRDYNISQSMMDSTNEEEMKLLREKLKENLQAIIWLDRCDSF